MIVDGEEVWTVLGQHQVWPEEPVEPPVTLGEAGRWPAVEWSLDGDRDLVTVVGERAGEYAIPEPVGPMPAVEGEQVDVTYQGRYLVLRQVWWTVGRPLHLLVVWNVEDLCVPSPVVTTTTVVAPSTTIVECLCAPPLPGPAPTPAVPVRTTAAYTG